VILFFDIDGVITTVNSYWRDKDFLDRSCIENLNTLVKWQNADIVISSSWKYLHSFEKLNNILVNAGLVKSAIGVIPDYPLS